MVAVQGPSDPSRMLAELLESFDRSGDEIRIAAAYATQAGVQLVIGRMSVLFGDRWATIPKQIVLSLDFGHTEPAALKLLAALPQSELRIFPSSRREDNYRPSNSAFHPKAFLMREGAAWKGLVGSANLTARAFTSNVEVGVSIALNAEEGRALWDPLWNPATPFTDELLSAYESWRETMPTESLDEVAVPQPPGATKPQPPSRPSAVAPAPQAPRRPLWAGVQHGFDPAEARNMWVEVGRPSGGSGNQLELPRGGCHFFGAAAPRYGYGQSVLGLVTIESRGRSWGARKLTWHGNNRMERLNLPTQAQGGERYDGKVILFERLAPWQVRMTVEDWDSDTARAWRQEAELAGGVFKLGENSPRVVGLF